MRIKKVNGVLLAVVLSLLMFVPGCSFQNEKIETTPQVQKQAIVQVASLLGDLNEKVSDSTRKQLEGIVAEAIMLCENREEKEEYEMDQTEEKLWTKISKMLDKETIRQYGKIEDEDEEEEEEENQVDYIEGVLNRLKSVLSKEDYHYINELMDTVNNEESSVEESITAEQQMHVLLQKYPQLDEKSTIMNLLDEGNQQHLAVYKINEDDSIIYQNGGENGLKPLNIKKQKELMEHWTEIKKILPESALDKFEYFSVTTDGEYGSSAYVMRIDSEGQNWCISIDPADVLDDGLFPYTMVHEYAHYLSLNETQVEYYDTDVVYPMEWYSDYECVAKDDSYLQAYYERFWEPILMDWMSDSENVYFYMRHQNEFVTEYAATDCSEDFAESFSGFVLEKKAATVEIQRKYDFFAHYPEFVTLKKEIVNNIKENNIWVNPEIDPPYEDELAA